MRTLACRSRIEVEIKRSRFVAHAGRVDSLADTLAFYESVADPSATHNCWAWKLDHQYRFNDDGEPASTAGKPILSAIEGKSLEYTMVVVTRYFGGIKLGVGGLVRAYSGSASRCIDKASVIDVQPVVRCCIEAGFDWTGQVYAAIEACAADKLSEDFESTGVRVWVEVREPELDHLKSLLQDTTRGEAKIRISG
jgi:uncharacterized YigZ family protein